MKAKMISVATGAVVIAGLGVAGLAANAVAQSKPQQAQGQQQVREAATGSGETYVTPERMEELKSWTDISTLHIVSGDEAELSTPAQP